MKKIGLYVLSLLIGMQAAVLFSHARQKTEPTFALSIEEKPLSAENTPGTHLVLVKYTNIPATVQWDSCVVSPWVYSLAVLRDGTPMERRTKAATETESQEEGNDQPGRHKIRVFDSGPVCSKLARGIDPGQTVKFTLWATAEFDMSVPGTYDITVSRETDRGHPERSLIVKSNTISITVLPTDNPPSTKQ